MRAKPLSGLPAVLGLGAALLVGLHLYLLLFVPWGGRELPGIVEIPSGASVLRAGKILAREAWIPSVPAFVFLARLTRDAGPIKAGEYRLSPDMSPYRILEHLRRGVVVLHRLTVPEGLRTAEVAAIAARDLSLSEERFMMLAADRPFIASLGLDVPTLEGYLLPETYAFPKGVSEEEVIRKMVGAMLSFLDPGKRARARSLGMSPYQALILASIIQKEMGLESEGPLISSVYHNRLRRNMRLQSDPTVIYGIPDFDGDLRWKDLKRDTPYNTYLRKGLPPTPIANPGRAAILAALHPAETDYLYFVSRNDGTHVFSRTLSRHNREVERYQRGR